MPKNWFTAEDISGGQYCTPSVVSASGDYVKFSTEFSYINTDPVLDHHIIIYRNGDTGGAAPATCDLILAEVTVAATGSAYIAQTVYADDDVCLAIVDENTRLTLTPTGSDCITGGITPVTIDTSSAYTWAPSGLGYYEINGSISIEVEDLYQACPFCSNDVASPYASGADGRLNLTFDYVNNTYDENHHLILYANGDCNITGAGGSKILDEFVVGPSVQTSAASAPSTPNLDPNFLASANGPVNSITTDASGNAIFGGSFTNYNGSGYNYVATVDSSGNQILSPVTNFDGNVNSIVRNNLNGHLYAGGQFTTYDTDLIRNRFVALSGDGTPIDTTINFNGDINSIDIDYSTGNIHLGGAFTQTSNAKYRNTIANKNTSVQSQFAYLTNGRINTVARDPSNDITYIGGTFTKVLGETRNRFAALSGDNVLANYTVNPSFDGEVYDIDVDGSGQVYIGGAFTGFYDSYLNGTQVSQPTVDGAVHAVKHDPITDNVYIGGEFLNVAGNSRSRFAAINNDTLTSLSIDDPSVSGTITAIDVKPDGSEIFIVGDFTNVVVNSVSYFRKRFAALNSDGTVITYTNNPSLNLIARDVAYDPSDGNIYVVGDFTANEEGVIQRIAKIDKTTTEIIEVDLLSDSTIETVAWDSTRDIYYIGGNFTQISSIPRVRFAAFNGSGTLLDIGNNPEFNNIVRSISIDETRNIIHIGGDFTTVDAGSGADSRNYFASISGDGTLIDYTTNPSFNSSIYAVTYDPNQDKIYVGGTFTECNSLIRQNFAALNGVDAELLSLSGSNPNFNNLIFDIDYDPSGNVYVGGSFTQSQSPVNRFMEIDTTVVPNDLTNLQPVFGGGTVYTVAKDEANDIYYIGGSFSSVYGQSRSNFAAISGDGTLIDYAVNPNFGGAIRDIEFDSARNRLYVAGQFFSVNSDSTKSYFCVLNAADGSVISTPGDASSTCYAVKYDSNNDRIYVGGQYTSFFGNSRSRFAVIDASTLNLISFTNNPTFNSTVWDIDVDSNTNDVYVGGQFTTVSTSASFTKNRYVVFDSSMNVIDDVEDIQFDSTVYAIERDVINDRINFGGQFNNIFRSIERFSIIDSETEELSVIAPKFNSTIRTIKKDINRNIYYVGGNFTQVNNQTRNRFAAISGDGTLIDYAVNPDFGSDVYSIDIDYARDKIYVGGAFNTTNGDATKSYLAALSGADCSSLNFAEANGAVYAVKYDPDRDIIHTAGSFTTIDDGGGSVTRNRFASISGDGTLIDYAVNPNVNSVVYTLDFDSINGDIYLGGAFTTVNGTERRYYAVLDEDANLKTLPTTYQPGFNSTVEALYRDETNDKVYMTGGFNASFESADRFVELNANTREKVSNLNATFNNRVYKALKDESRDIYYFCGDFTFVNGQSRNRFAAISGDGTLIDYAVNPSLNNDALDMIQDPVNDRIYIGGQFTVVNGLFSTHNYLVGINRSDGSIYNLPRPNSWVTTLDYNGPNTLYIGGLFTDINDGASNTRNRFAVIDISGSSVINYATNVSFNSSVYAVEYDSVNDRVYIGGDFGFVDDSTGSSLVRTRFAALDLSTNNFVDYSTNPDVAGRITEIKYDSGNDEILIGGSFIEINSDTSYVRMVSMDPSDATFTSFAGPDNSVEEIEIDTVNDRIYIVGTFDSVDGDINQRYWATYDRSTKQLLEAKTPLANRAFTALYEPSTDNIILAGDFLDINYFLRDRFAAISGSGDFLTDSTDISLSSTGYSINYDETKDVVYVGGAFSSVNGNSDVSYVAAISGGDTLLPFKSGLNNNVFAIEIDNDDLVLGGTFTQGNSRTFNGAVSISGDNKTVLHDNLGIGTNVYDIVTDYANDIIYYGGSFTNVGGDAEKDYVISFNGSDFSQNSNYSKYPNSTVWGLHFDQTLDTLSVLGQFTLSEPVATRNRYAGFDSGGEFFTGEGTINSIVNTVKYNSDNGNVLLGGSFTLPSGYFLEMTNGITESPTSSGLVFSSSIQSIEIDDSSGDIYYGGAFTAIGNEVLRISQYDKNTGTLQPINVSVNNNGVLAVKKDTTRNIIYIGGSFTEVNGQTRNRFAAISGDGNLIDYNFNPDFDNVVYSLDVDETTGEIFVGGGFTSVTTSGGSQTRNRFAIVNSDGTLKDFSVNPGFDNFVYSVNYDDTQDTVYCGGAFATVTDVSGSNSASRLAALSGGGEFFSNYPNQPALINSNVYNIEFDNANDRVYIGGVFSSIDGNGDYSRFAALNKSDLSLITSRPLLQFNNFIGLYGGISVNPNNGRVYIGGQFTSASTPSGPFTRNRFAAVDVNGNLIDYSTNPDFNSIIYSLGYDSSTDIVYPVGLFAEVNSEARLQFAAISGSNGELLETPSIGFTNGSTFAIEIDGDELTIGGSYTTGNAEPSLRFAKTDSLFNPQSVNFAFNNQVRDIAIGNDIHAVGYFTDSGNLTSLSYYVGLTSGGITDLSLPSGFNNRVRTVDVDEIDNVLYFGGDFTNYNNSGINYAVSISGGNVSSFDIDVNNSVYDILVENDDVYAVGEFTEGEYVDRSRYAVLDSSFNLIDYPTNPSFDGIVNAVKYDPVNDRVHVAGAFTTVNSSGSVGFASLSGSGEIVDYTSLNLGTFTTGRSIALDVTNNRVIVGGESSTTSNALWAINTSGGSTSLDPGFNSAVYALDIESDRDILYVGGNFTVPYNYLVGLNLDGTLNTSFNSHINNTVRSLKDSAEYDITYVGGDFTDANGSADRLTSIRNISDITTCTPSVSAVSLFGQSENGVCFMILEESVYNSTVVQNASGSFMTCEGISACRNPCSTTVDTSAFVPGTPESTEGTPRNYSVPDIPSSWSSNTYIENGESEVNINESSQLDMSSISLEIELFTDNFAGSETELVIESPEGTTHNESLTDNEFGSVFNYNGITTFSGDTNSNGFWKVYFIDSYGDGGAEGYNITLTFDNGFIIPATSGGIVVTTTETSSDCGYIFEPGGCGTACEESVILVPPGGECPTPLSPLERDDNGINREQECPPVCGPGDDGGIGEVQPDPENGGGGGPGQPAAQNEDGTIFISDPIPDPSTACVNDVSVTAIATAIDGSVDGTDITWDVTRNGAAYNNVNIVTDGQSSTCTPNDSAPGDVFVFTASVTINGNVLQDSTTVKVAEAPTLVNVELIRRQPSEDGVGCFWEVNFVVNIDESMDPADCTLAPNVNWKFTPEGPNLGNPAVTGTANWGAGVAEAAVNGVKKVTYRATFDTDCHGPVEITNDPFTFTDACNQTVQGNSNDNYCECCTQAGP
jgi:hypothetical protein